MEPSIEELRAKTSRWTLAEDSQLCSMFEGFSRMLKERTESLQARMTMMTRNIAQLDVSIEAINGHLDLLASRQFVEQQISEDDYIRPSSSSVAEAVQQKTIQQRQEEALDSIKSAIRSGISFVGSSGDSRVELVLPPLIGSSEFHQQCIGKQAKKLEKPPEIPVSEPDEPEKPMEIENPAQKPISIVENQPVALLMDEIAGRLQPGPSTSDVKEQKLPKAPIKRGGLFDSDDSADEDEEEDIFAQAKRRVEAAKSESPFDKSLDSRKSEKSGISSKSDTSSIREPIQSTANQKPQNEPSQAYVPSLADVLSATTNLRPKNTEKPQPEPRISPKIAEKPKIQPPTSKPIQEEIAKVPIQPKVYIKEEPVAKVKNEPQKVPIKKEPPVKKSIFDESDSDSDLFSIAAQKVAANRKKPQNPVIQPKIEPKIVENPKAKPPEPEVKQKIVEKPKPVEPVKAKTTVVPVKKTGGLFDSDSDDDLFAVIKQKSQARGFQPQKQQQQQQLQQPAKASTAPKPSRGPAEKPKSLFDDSDSDEDLFSKSTQSSSKSSTSRSKTEIPQRKVSSVEQACKKEEFPKNSQSSRPENEKDVRKEPVVRGKDENSFEEPKAGQKVQETTQKDPKKEEKPQKTEPKQLAEAKDPGKPVPKPSPKSEEPLLEPEKGLLGEDKASPNPKSEASTKKSPQKAPADQEEPSSKDLPSKTEPLKSKEAKVEDFSSKTGQEKPKKATEAEKTEVFSSLEREKPPKTEQEIGKEPFEDQTKPRSATLNLAVEDDQPFISAPVIVEKKDPNPRSLISPSILLRETLDSNPPDFSRPESPPPPPSFPTSSDYDFGRLGSEEPEERPDFEIPSDPETSQGLREEMSVRGKLNNAAFASKLNATLAKPPPPGGVRLFPPTPSSTKSEDVSPTSTSPIPPTLVRRTISEQAASSESKLFDEKPALLQSVSKNRVTGPARRPPSNKSIVFRSGSSELESNRPQSIAGIPNSASSTAGKPSDEPVLRKQISTNDRRGAKSMVLTGQSSAQEVPKLERKLSGTKISTSPEKPSVSTVSNEIAPRKTSITSISQSPPLVRKGSTGSRISITSQTVKSSDPPAVKKEEPKKKSLFDSESSDDDLFKKKTTVNVRPMTISSTTTTNKTQPAKEGSRKPPAPVTTGAPKSGTKTTSTATKKSLFDDSDDDLDVFRKK